MSSDQTTFLPFHSAQCLSSSLEQIEEDMSQLLSMFPRIWRFLTRQSDGAVVDLLVGNETSGASRQPWNKLRDRLDRRSMSPNSRVVDWKSSIHDHVETPVKNKNNKRTISPHHHLPTPDSLQFRPAKKLRLEPTTSSGPGSLSESISEYSQTPSGPAGNDTTATRMEVIQDTELTEVHEVPDDTVISVYYTPPSITKVQAIHHQHKAEAAELAAKGWPENDVFLYARLRARGYEPLMPFHWEMDFKTIPLALFTRDDKRAFINALALGEQQHNADFKATRALDMLLQAGTRIRDRVHAKLPAEVVTKKAIKAYVEWSLRDAGLWKKKAYLPNLAIVCGPRAMRPITLFTKAVRALEKLHLKWERAIYRNTCTSTSAFVPPLYVAMVSHTAMFIFAYVPGNTTDDVEQSLRSIGHFSWTEAGKDVWNGLAAAILVIHCRDLLLDTLEDVRLDDGEIVAEDGVDLDA